MVSSTHWVGAGSTLFTTEWPNLPADWLLIVWRRLKRIFSQRKSESRCWGQLMNAGWYESMSENFSSAQVHLVFCVFAVFVPVCLFVSTSLQFIGWDEITAKSSTWTERGVAGFPIRCKFCAEEAQEFNGDGDPEFWTADVMRRK